MSERCYYKVEDTNSELFKTCEGRYCQQAQDDFAEKTILKSTIYKNINYVTD